MEKLVAAANWLLGPEGPDDRHPGHLWPRWIFLRALGLIYFSAFYSLLFQIKGLIGPERHSSRGRLSASRRCGRQTSPAQRFWYAPTLLWFGSSDRALMLLCWAGLIASVLVVLNLWPRASLAICFVCFLSFVAAAQDFSSYQSDGMLLEAGFISLFFAPPGLRPGLARRPRSIARQPIPAALGMVPHLFRIGRGEAGQRRPILAPPHRHGRLLPERPAANMDRLVRAAFAALVPCRPPSS